MANTTVRYNTSIVTGTLNTVSATSVTGANVHLGGSYTKVADLTAYLILTAATSSITITPYWQVSNDASTFTTIQSGPQSPANIAIVTGTANTTKAIEPPRGVYGYRFARCMLLVGGATGGASDLYSIGYSYRQLDS